MEVQFDPSLNHNVLQENVRVGMGSHLGEDWCNDLFWIALRKELNKAGCGHLEALVADP